MENTGLGPDEQASALDGAAARSAEASVPSQPTPYETGALAERRPPPLPEEPNAPAVSNDTGPKSGLSRHEAAETLNIPIEPFGLRLVLGGGVCLVSREEAVAGSTTVLIRGGPGTGKTVLGTHIATAIAELLQCDVAYGCVEILPPELAAVVEGLDVSLEVEPAPWSSSPESSVAPRVLAGNLALGEKGGQQASLLEALNGLISAAAAAGANPRVVVVDSLSDSHQLGGGVPRTLVDDVCKMAAGAGRILVLLEECVDSRPSPWSFATDVVLELSLKESAEHGGALIRTLSVIKNRFGPTEPGPHPMVIVPGEGVSIRPRVRSYMHPWSASALFPGREPDLPSTDRWGNFAKKEFLPPFEQCSCLASGNDRDAVMKLTAGLGEWRGEEPGTHVIVRIGGKHAAEIEGEVGVAEVPLWGPLAGHEELLARIVDVLVRTMERGPIRRILIGDLTHLKNDPNEEQLRRLLISLLDFARQALIPVVLFQTGAGPQDSFISALVDVFAEVHSPATNQQVVLRLRRSWLALHVPLRDLRAPGTLLLLRDQLAKE